MRAYRNILIITSLVVLLPLIAGLILWSRLPAEMAIHFGADGQADGFASRGLAVFGLPLFLLAMHLLCAFVTLHDPKRENISGKIYHLVLWLMPVISVVSGAMLYLYALGITTDTLFFVKLLLGLLFVILGNYLPKCRQNYTVGIKLPWTLADPDNWNRTHRMAGWLWILGGLLLLADALLHFLPDWAFLPLLLLMGLVPMAYSFLLHLRRERGART